MSATVSNSSPRRASKTYTGIEVPPVKKQRLDSRSPLTSATLGASGSAIKDTTVPGGSSPSEQSVKMSNCVASQTSPQQGNAMCSFSTSTPGMDSSTTFLNSLWSKIETVNPRKVALARHIVSSVLYLAWKYDAQTMFDCTDSWWCLNTLCFPDSICQRLMPLVKLEKDKKLLQYYMTWKTKLCVLVNKGRCQKCLQLFSVLQEKIKISKTDTPNQNSSSSHVLRTIDESNTETRNALQTEECQNVSIQRAVSDMAYDWLAPTAQWASHGTKSQPQQTNGTNDPQRPKRTFAKAQIRCSTSSNLQAADSNSSTICQKQTAGNPQCLVNHNSTSLATGIGNSPQGDEGKGLSRTSSQTFRQWAAALIKLPKSVADEQSELKETQDFSCFLLKPSSKNTKPVQTLDPKDYPQEVTVMRLPHRVAGTRIVIDDDDAEMSSDETTSSKSDQQKNQIETTLSSPYSQSRISHSTSSTNSIQDNLEKNVSPLRETSEQLKLPSPDSLIGKSGAKFTTFLFCEDSEDVEITVAEFGEEEWQQLMRGPRSF